MSVGRSVKMWLAAEISLCWIDIVVMMDTVQSLVLRDGIFFTQSPANFWGSVNFD